MLNFDALIRHFGPAAVEMSLRESEQDSKAISAIRDQWMENRTKAIRKWLNFYNALQGLKGDKRDAVSETALKWADSQTSESKLETMVALVNAHADLEKACSQAYGKDREFTSLASKALWLRYPNQIPICDGFVEQALWTLSKLEPDLPSVPEGATRYGAFVLIWRTLYDRYAPSIAAIDNKGYPYRVRIFDRILWLVGAPVYGISNPPRS